MRVDRVNYVGVARHYIEPLLEEHFREVGNTAVYELAPDWDKYFDISHAGNLIALLAFDDRKCVGYSVNFLTPHVHYVKQRICYNDVLFVAKDYRTGSAGGRLLNATVQHAREAGATVMQWHAKPNTALDQLLSKRMPIFEHAYAQSL